MNSGTSQDFEATTIEVVRSTDASSLPRPKFENQTIIRQFELACTGSETLAHLLAQSTAIISEQSECLALWISQADEAGHFSKFQALTGDSADPLWETIEPNAMALVEHLDQTNQIGSVSLPFPTPTQLVAAPIRTQSNPDGRSDFVLLGCFQIRDQTVLRLQWLLGIATQAIANWFQSRSLLLANSKLRNLSEAVRLISALDQTTSQSASAIVAVNQLRQILNVEQVALTVRGVLVAISNVEQIDSQSESNKLIQVACNQSAASSTAIVYPGSDEQTKTETLALERYCRHLGWEACINLPLNHHDQSPMGGLLIAGSPNRLNTPALTEFLPQLASLIGSHLDLVLRANRGAKEITSETFHRLRKHRWRTTLLFAIAGLTTAMCFPMPYRIPCNCELQPVLRRFVAAPFDGILEKAMVENGQIVAQNQLLAQLDGRNLRIELAGLSAELVGAKKRCDSALATGDIAQSQIARSETKRMEAKIELLQQRVGNLEVRSPIAGVIVSGDLEKVQGAPLEMGQTLFEVAPLDQMVGEIAIPETEIKYVQPHQAVAIKLNAFPFQTWRGTIKSVHPRAEIIDDESVFVAQVLLKNDEDSLRPGMKGSAKIKSTMAPLGWSLFHRPWESIRYWTVW